MKIKKLWPIIIVVIGFLYFFISGNHNNEQFYKEQINSKLIKRSNWQIRTTEFYMENKLRIDSNYLYNFDLKIGDSISKKKKTKNFDVYRKENGKYKFYKKYITQ